MTNNRSTNMTPDFTTYTAHLGTPLESYSPMKTRSSPLLGRTQLKPQTLAGSSLQNPTRSTHFNLTNHSTATMETMPEATVSMKRLGGGSLKPATDLSPVSEKGEGGGNMFELFRTHDGEEEYTVYVREDGKKFYVDWEEQVRCLCRYDYLSLLPRLHSTILLEWGLGTRLVCIHHLVYQ